MARPRNKPAEWHIVGQHWHAVIGRGADGRGDEFVRTACGWLIWPSALDTRLREAPVCRVCADKHPPPSNAGPAGSV